MIDFGGHEYYARYCFDAFVQTLLGKRLGSRFTLGNQPERIQRAFLAGATAVFNATHNIPGTNLDLDGMAEAIEAREELTGDDNK